MFWGNDEKFSLGGDQSVYVWKHREKGLRSIEQADFKGPCQNGKAKG